MSLKVFVVANDKVALNLVRFVASARFFFSGADISYIPFNSDDLLVREICAVFQIPRFDTSCAVIDEFGQEFFEDNIPQQPFPYMLGKLRKLSIFDVAGPGMYIDIDSVFTSPVFSTFATERLPAASLGFVTTSTEWVYKDTEEGRPLLAGSKLFSSGLILKTPGCPGLAEILNHLRANRERYHRVRVQGVVDQPMLNFVVDTMPGIGAFDLTADGRMSSSVTPSKRLVTAADWTVSCTGVPVPFVHAAGHFKQDLSLRFLFDSMLLRGLATIAAADRQLANRLMDMVMQPHNFPIPAGFNH